MICVQGKKQLKGTAYTEKRTNKIHTNNTQLSIQVSFGRVIPKNLQNREKGKRKKKKEKKLPVITTIQ